MSIFELKKLCQKYLKGISETLIASFVESMLGHEHKRDSYLGVAHGIKNHFKKYNSTDEVLRMAKQISVILHSSVKDLLKEAKPLLTKSIQSTTNIIELSSSSSQSKTPSKPLISLDQTNQSTKQIFRKICPQQPRKPLRSNECQVQRVREGVCVCGKKPPQQKRQLTMQCLHCNNLYHLDCLHKALDSKHCSICYLRLMNPTKVVMKTLFVGVLKKNKKKHQILFSEEQLKKYQTEGMKVHIRCMRLKQQTQTFILFPDSCSILLNGTMLKEYQPLHKQCSVKYRKDEVLNVPYSKLSQSNKLSVIEKHSLSKEDKIQSQHHVIGVYVVKDQPINSIIHHISNESNSTIEQSHEILKKCFKQFDEVFCEKVKVSLLCPLSLEPMKTPVRGVLCSHIQCFDLGNYLKMMSHSSCARWVCPLCKVPAYMFKVDSILKRMIKWKGNEVEFHHQGKYSVVSNEDSKQIIVRTGGIHQLENDRE